MKRISKILILIGILFSFNLNVKAINLNETYTFKHFKEKLILALNKNQNLTKVSGSYYDIETGLPANVESLYETATGVNLESNEFILTKNSITTTIKFIPSGKITTVQIYQGEPGNDAYKLLSFEYNDNNLQMQEFSLRNKESIFAYSVWETPMNNQDPINELDNFRITWMRQILYTLGFMRNPKNSSGSSNQSLEEIMVRTDLSIEFGIWRVSLGVGVDDRGNHMPYNKINVPCFKLGELNYSLFEYYLVNVFLPGIYYLQKTTEDDIVTNYNFGVVNQNYNNLLARNVQTMYQDKVKILLGGLDGYLVMENKNHNLITKVLNFDNQACPNVEYKKIINDEENYKGLGPEYLVPVIKFSQNQEKHFYTGNEVKPVVTVLNAQGAEISSENYTLTYHKNTYVGNEANVIVSPQGSNYNFTPQSLTFEITPLETKLVQADKPLTVGIGSTDLTSFVIIGTTPVTSVPSQIKPNFELSNLIPGVNLNGSTLVVDSTVATGTVIPIEVKFAGNDQNGDTILEYKAASDIFLSFKTVTSSNPLQITITKGTYQITKVYDGTTDPVQGSGSLEVTGIQPGDDVRVVVQENLPNYSNRHVHLNSEFHEIELGLKGEDQSKYKLDNHSISVPYNITPVETSVSVDVSNGVIIVGNEVDLKSKTSVRNLPQNITPELEFILEEPLTGVNLNNGKLTVDSSVAADQTIKITAKFIGKDLNDDGIKEYTASETTVTMTTATVGENIERVELTLQPRSFKVSKEYDGSTNAGTPTGALELSGIVGDDDVTADVTLKPYSNADVHTEDIELEVTLNGADKDKYTLKQSKIKVPYEIIKSTTSKSIKKQIYACTNSDNGYYKISIKEPILPLDAKLLPGSEIFEINSFEETTDSNDIIKIIKKDEENPNELTIEFNNVPDSDKTAEFKVKISCLNFDLEITYEVKTVIDQMPVRIIPREFTRTKVYDGTQIEVEKGLDITAFSPQIDDNSTGYGNYNDDEIKVKYKSTDNRGYDSDNPPKEVGQYQVTYSFDKKIAGSTGYIGQETAYFEITEAAPITIPTPVSPTPPTQDPTQDPTPIPTPITTPGTSTPTPPAKTNPAASDSKLDADGNPRTGPVIGIGTLITGGFIMGYSFIKKNKLKRI